MKILLRPICWLIKHDLRNLEKEEYISSCNRCSKKFRDRIHYEPVERWQHHVTVFDKEKNKATHYVNGKLIKVKKK